MTKSAREKAMAVDKIEETFVVFVNDFGVSHEAIPWDAIEALRAEQETAGEVDAGVDALRYLLNKSSEKPKGRFETVLDNTYCSGVSTRDQLEKLWEKLHGTRS